MLDSTAAALAGLVSVITLCLSRCRCLLRTREDGQWEAGVGFTDAHLFAPRELPRAAFATVAQPDP